MTIKDVISMVDGLKANQITGAQKLRWLSECDSTIFNDIIAVHENDGSMPVVFKGYTDADVDTELLAKAPHDILYRHYLEMQIDLYNKELANYNNSNRLYNAALTAFSNWYTRNHMPTGQATHFKL
jgi:hypothetical protein